MLHIFKAICILYIEVQLITVTQFLKKQPAVIASLLALD